MKAYKVEGGVARVGLGEVVGLTEDQAAARSMQVDVVRRDGAVVICRARQQLQFKSGETILLAEAPPKSMADVIHEVQGVSAPVAASKPNTPMKRSARKATTQAAG